jgi:hypothetical protein
MKFSNQLEVSMVPEWRQHYLDYKALKKKLKQVRKTFASCLFDGCTMVVLLTPMEHKALNHILERLACRDSVEPSLAGLLPPFT